MFTKPASHIPTIKVTEPITIVLPEILPETERDSKMMDGPIQLECKVCKWPINIYITTEDNSTSVGRYMNKVQEEYCECPLCDEHRWNDAGEDLSSNTHWKNKEWGCGRLTVEELDRFREASKMEKKRSKRKL